MELVNLGNLQVLLGVVGTPYSFKIVPHESKEDEIVLKAPVPEVGEEFCRVLGVTPAGPTVRGSRYFITPVKAEDFAKAMPRFFDDAVRAMKFHASVERDVQQAEAHAAAANADRDATQAFIIQNQSSTASLESVTSSACPACSLPNGQHARYCSTLVDAED